jgi:hypothetical protein
MRTPPAPGIFRPCASTTYCIFSGGGLPWAARPESTAQEETTPPSTPRVAPRSASPAAARPGGQRHLAIVVAPRLKPLARLRGTVRRSRRSRAHGCTRAPASKPATPAWFLGGVLGGAGWYGARARELVINRLAWGGDDGGENGRGWGRWGASEVPWPATAFDLDVRVSVGKGLGFCSVQDRHRRSRRGELETGRQAVRWPKICYWAAHVVFGQ